ncbi:hypothetical protein [Peredibacter starrii]|uniref:Uncharacterized protein n=1 Tax=Peredibacter starrii TaxID=28202 RepID=A0AAX4HPE3_9BACT|nr:hypothetical protein [Peredibacter starrii]WPU65189.1 hypothetical protein SOO65_00305 [Peredibacter starrii]
MKTIFAVAMIALSATSFAASKGSSLFLESYYGKLSVVGGKYACTLTNTTGADLDVKRVEFALERRAGKNRDLVSTKSVNSVVYANETTTVVSNASQAFIAHSCKFLAR